MLLAPAPTPCTVPATAAALRCPDLVMAAPSHVYTERVHSRALLHGTSRIENRGNGPIELRGRRTGVRTMAVTQVIHRGDGGLQLWPTQARLTFKPIPGQGSYWKLREAASLEVWSLLPDGGLDGPVRKSPKVDYCLRDLVRQTNPPPGAPARPVYPSCNQDGRRRTVTLGTSVGWIDRYPSDYHEQYVDVTGLQGRFAFVMRADPDGRLTEINEVNNAAWALVTLGAG